MEHSSISLTTLIVFACAALGLLFVFIGPSHSTHICECPDGSDASKHAVELYQSANLTTRMIMSEFDIPLHMFAHRLLQHAREEQARGHSADTMSKAMQLKNAVAIEDILARLNFIEQYLTKS